METFFQDVRYGVRMLLKKPGFTAIAVIALALGIGANTAIFSIVNALLLNPLPYKTPDKLVMLWQDYRAVNGPEREWVSPANFYDWRDQTQSFDGVAALIDWQPTLTGEYEPETLIGAGVSHDMFSVLGVQPALGRSFIAEEDQPTAERVVVLSHALWKRRFASDRFTVGKSMNLGGESFTVVGVMPESFRFPLITNAEIWRPLRPLLSPRCGRACVVLRVIARMKPETTLESARSEMTGLSASLAQAYPMQIKRSV